MLPRRLRTWLRSPLVIIGSMFVLACLGYLLRNTMTHSELDSMLHARHFAFPQYLGSDWYFTRPGSPRLPSEIVYYPFVRFLPLVWASIGARTLEYLLISIGLGLIAWRLGHNALTACITLAIYIFVTGQSYLLVGDDLIQRAESMHLGYALLFFGLYCVMRGRIVAGAAWAGLATTIHVIVGGWGSVALAMAVLTMRMATVRQVALGTLAWLAAGSVGLYFTLSFLGSSSTELAEDPNWIYVYFRHPHLMDVTDWRWPKLNEEGAFWGKLVPRSIPLLMSVFFAWLMFRKAGSHRKQRNLIGHLVAWAFVPFFVGVVLCLGEYWQPETFHFAPKFLQLYPFRVACTLIIPLGMFIAVPIALRRLRYLRPWPKRWLQKRFEADPGVDVACVEQAARRVWRRRRVFIDIVVVGLAVGAFTWGTFRTIDSVQLLKIYPLGALTHGGSLTHERYDVCAWIRDNTEEDAIILSTPREKTLAYLMERGQIVRFQSVPSSRADIVEWYTRLVAFNKGNPIEDRGYSAGREVEGSFRSMTETQFLALGRRYGARYLLLRDRTFLRFKRVYHNDSYAVFDMADGITPNSRTIRGMRRNR